MEKQDIIDIISGCQKDDRRAQEAFYKAFAGKMFGVCLFYIKERETAKDILHDAFMKAYQSMGKVGPAQNVEAWLRRITVNTALDFLRRQAKIRFSALDSMPNDPPGHINALDIMAEGDIMGMVEQLPEGARIIFKLYSLEGFDHKEIAQKLGINEETSRSQFARARKLLQKMVSVEAGVR